LDSTNVLIGSTGAAYVAPLATAAPTTAVVALNAAFVDLGYLSDDGVTETYDDSTDEITAWQGGVVVRRVISSSSATLQFTMIESKVDTLELFHKGSTMETDGATGFKMDVLAPTADRRSFVLDVLDGTTHIRLYVANGEVTERGEVTYANNGEALSYPVTITCYPVDDVVLTKFSDSAAWDPA
jgi:hypothetical protein